MTQDSINYYKSLIQKFTLLDDTFMRIVFKNKECAELLIRVILDKKDLVIEDVKIQENVDDILLKSVIMDILATDTDGNLYNIEVQRDSNGARPKRARYHSSMIDTHILEKGKDTESLPNTYVIFITQEDVLGDNEIIYNITRTIKKSNKEFNDGSNIIYVNTSIQDDSPIGRLNYDLRCSEPDNMNYEILKKEVDKNKNEKRRVEYMCQIMENLKIEAIEEGIEKGRFETIVDLFKNGLEISNISKFLKMDESEIKNILSSSGIKIEI